MKVVSMHPPLPQPNASSDTPTWRYSIDGIFSMKSAYEAVLNHNLLFSEDPLWKLVWPWEVWRQEETVMPFMVVTRDFDG